ncbi:Ig-like domain repeat protein [Methanobrevibacter sp.]|uniref:Ig-like domain repeat protein n=1 Tax=Methanobrevibacter sp. TaxID=66852 RepID=UPI0025F6C50D|nr:Ig-like domain repeat protein [Methanobrevibacter sp.]MBQ6512857.1 Ig-like domain repeat protein [Methanobrevibacter sp.]
MFDMYPGNGGGMVMRGWDSYAYNCTFINNTAKSNGGASYLTNTSYNPMNNNTGFILCTFIDNTAGINGGAIEWANNATYGYVYDSVFTNNTAKRSGGAIYWYGHNGTISNSSFINNKALGIVDGPRPDGSITSGGDGGAIVMTGANANILNSTFTLNNASRNGGAIFMHGGPNDDCTNVTVDGSKFIENYAGVNGGALDWYEGAHDATLSNSILINNTAKRSGGAVYWYGHDGTIRNSTFTNNSALGLVNATDSYGNITSGGHGGAIMWTGANGKVLNSTFTLNNASRNGGAIYMQGSKDGDCSNITVDGSKFVENYAGVNGGAVDWYEGAHDSTLSNSYFANNTAERSGGAVYWYGHDGTIRNSTFINNQALGLVNATDSYGNITSGGHGGAIMWTGLNGNILNSTFSLNNASRNGGAIFMQGSIEDGKTIDCSNMTVDGSNFTENYAGINGGALDWYEGAHDSILSNSNFVNNTAERSGGAVYWYGHDGSIINSTFTNNTAKGNVLANDSYGRETYGGHGGAIMWTGANGKVLNSTFTSNNATRNGGAIYMQGSEDGDCSNITVDGSAFIENHAGINGGALDWYEGAHDSTLSNSTFINNTAERNGGAIYWYGHNGTVANSTFIDNVATGEYHQYDMTLNMSTDLIIIEGDELPSSPQEGKLYVLDNSSSKTDVQYISYVYDNGNWIKLDDFTSNEKSASPADWAIDQFFGGDGGSIYWTGDLGTVDNCTFINSKSARRGGGAYMTGGDNITFSNCNFINGTSGTNGGGVDWLAGANNGKLINCTFTDNQAARSAGAIYYDGDNGQIINVTIINSYAHGGDKGFTSSDDRVTYVGWDSSHWDTNTTGGDGGAVMFTGSNNYVYNLTVTNCTAVGRGGAIFIQDCSNITIEASTFKNNTALGTANNTNTKKETGHGGAIAFDTGATNSAIDGSIFDGNHAVMDGGAINFASGAEYDNLTNSIFTNNTAGDDGGAINWEGNNGYIYNITAVNNKGISFNESNSKGGTMCLVGGNITLTKSTFNDSFAGDDGGAIFVTGSNVNITDSSFNNCSSDSNAGAIYVIGDETLIADCSFDNCSSFEDGGVLYIEGDYGKVYTSTFDNNTAGDDGGAIYWKGHDGIIDGCAFVDNIGTSAGDPNDPSTSKGGTLSIIGENVDIFRSNFTGGLTKNRNNNNTGGTIFITGNNVTIDSCNFNNSAAEGADGGTIYIIGNHTDISNSTFSNSTARAGGAIYIEGIGTFIGATNFTETSAKSGSKYNSNNLGGAIYIKGIDTIVSHSNFENSSAYDGGFVYMEGDNGVVMYSSLNNGHALRSGGAIYSTGSHSTVSNSNFTNNLAELSGGAMYWYGGSSSKNNTVDGCIFTNNTAHGDTSGTITRGGGAIYWSEGGTKGVVKNSEFYYNSVQSTIDKKVDGGAILWDKSTHALVDNCIFVGNFVTTEGDTSGTGAGDVWAQGGAMYLRPNGNYTVRNCLFENCSSSKEAGALYIQSNGGNDRKALVENCIFKNNVAQANGKYNINGGGAIQVKQASNIEFKNLTFINNTANKGGALCVFDSTSNLVVDGANFTGNKADRGSAISVSKSFTLKNAVLLENTATSTKLDLTFDRDAGTIDILFEGKDNRLNAMYVTGNSVGVDCNNVTYWTDNNISTGKQEVTSTRQTSTTSPVPEAGIGILVEIFDGNNNKLHEGIYATDADGKIHLGIADILDEPYSLDDIYVTARLPNEDYYTMIEATSRIKCDINASALDTIFHRNTTITANISAPGNGTGQAARGNVSVYIDDVFKGNMTIENSKGSLENLLTNVTADKFFEAGNHTVFLKYWGDTYFDESNATISFNITKAQSNSTVTFDDIGYDISMNVTIFDEWNDKFYGDANGTATVEFYNENDPTALVRFVDVRIVDGFGSTVVSDLLPRNYTVKTIYHDDNNYNSSVNTTNYSLPQKDFAAVFVEVNAYDIMVDDTIYINVTIVPPDGYNVPGNVTLYLDNQGHNLTLTMGANNATAKFNATNLTAGFKKVIVFYEGSKLLEPAMGEADFTVHKYNTTLSANVTNITIVQNEIINITLLNDTTGVVSVIVDGKEYFGRINNGTASIVLPQLPVGEYNVTLYYEGDGKYNNVTNYTLFKVSQVTPEMTIDIENVTYGNSTHIVITLPEDAEGNVSIKIDGDPFDVPKPVDKGRVEFVVEYLTAGNYTLEATYTGDVNYTAVSSEQKFKVYKANRTIVIEVQDIPYGEIEHIKVFVNATGNVTIFVDGRNKTIELSESDVPATILRAIVDAISEYKGKAALDVYDLNVGEYPVEVIYNGDENYNKASAKATFIVYEVNTTLVIDAHNVLVWDNEYINVTVRNSTGGIAVNATGNITLYIGDVFHTAEIIDGVARFNTTTSQVGNRVVWAFYDGDINFVGNRSMKTFEVEQRTPIVNVTAQNITVDGTESITINIPANATGYVILTGNFTDDEIYVGQDKFTNGVAVIPIDGLAVGNYSVHIKYYGDALDNYTVAENDTTFRVDKINTTVTIDVKDINYTESANITVTVLPGVEGNITIKLNDTTGRNVTLPIVEGKVNWIVDGLAAGNYTVNVTYNGNDDYNINNTESERFEVKKIDPTLQIYPPSSTAGEKAIITIFINDRIDGEYVTITGLDKEYTKEIMNGVVTFTTDGPLNYNDYTMTVTYGGNQNFTESTKSFTFRPSKISDYEINVTGMNITVSEDEIITVNVPAGVTNVSIWVNGTKYTNDSFTNGEAKFNITGLKEGVYKVNATVNDANYTSKVANDVFTVSKTYPSINITVVNDTSIYVDDTVKVIVTVPSDVTENVTIEINGMQFTNKTVNGNATFYIPGITYGNKTVVATYSGDDKYRFNSTTANFTVSKRTPVVNVTNITIIEGKDAVINISGPADRNATLVVTVDGVDYAVNMTGGNATLTVKGLSVDNYTVSVTYIENDKYVEATAGGWVNVTAKGTSAINITVEDVYYVGQDIVITLKPINSTGDVSVTINGKEYTVTGNKVTIENGLPNGTYEIVAVLDEDENYYGSTSNKTFNVIKNDITITVNDTTVPAAIYVDSPVTFTANLNETVTGDVTFTINGANYTVHVSDSNVATYEYTPVNNGTITVVATFLGNDKYKANVSAAKQFNVNRIPTDINVTVKTPVTYGDDAVITVELNETINTTAKLLVDGKEYDVAIVNGKGAFNASGLSSGDHKVNVTYVGDDRYAGSKNSTTFTVDNATLDAEVTAFNVTVEQNTTFVINVTDDFNGNVSIKVGDEVLYNGSVKTLIYADKLPAGYKTATVVFYGDSNYNVLTLNDVKFTVSRVTPEITVEIDDVTYPANATAVINVGNNANGTVKVTVTNKGGTDSKVFNGTVSNGVANVNLTHLSGGIKVASVEFVTSDDYNGNATAGDEFTVLPNNSLIVAVKDKEGTYNVGEDVVITFTTINSTGNFDLFLNGVHYGDTLYPNPATHVVSFEGLGVGNYTITAVLDYDENYTGDTTEVTFEIVKNESFIRVDATNSTVDGEAIINVTVPANAVGYVVVDVNGTKYSINLTAGEDRVAVKVTEDGLYNVTVTYLGDDNYLPSSNKTNFTVAKLNTTVTIDVNDTVYDNAVNVVVTVDEDVEGTITIKLNDTEIGTYGIVDGKVNITLYDLGAENYTIYAEYNGNYKYNENKTESKNFTVARATPVITIDKAITDANTSAVITVHVNDTATGTMNITVDGKSYEAPINDGVAEFTIDVLPVGEYDITADYYALTDTNYTVNSVTLVKGLNVTKVADYPMNVSAIDVKAGENTTITVTVPEDATGTVFIDVNGTKLNATVDHGKAVFNVTKEIAGRYVVNATLVDAKYGNKSVIGNYYVSLADTPMSIEVVEPVHANDTAKVIVTVPEDITGPVTIEINGESYVNKSVDGDKVTFEVPAITYGNKTVVAIYGGDAKYAANSTTANFTVVKNESFIRVDATNSTVDGEVIINVTVPANAVGYVVVNVNGTNYTINLTDGQGSIPINVTEAGLYDVAVTYIGDDNYLPSNNTTSFNVDKLTSFVNITVNNNGIIPNGTNVNITIHAPEDITGKVNVTVWFKERNVNTTYTVYVNDGEGILYLESPAVGMYNVTAIYLENRKYLENSNYTLFEVYDTEKELSVIPVNVSVFENGEVTVYLTGDQTGNTLTIIITNADGEVIRNESVPINQYIPAVKGSSAEWKLPLLEAGEYNVTAIYIENAGPRTYTHEGNGSFYVYKVASELEIKEIKNITVGENVVIELELTPGATGNISVFVNGYEHKTTADNLTVIIPNLGADEYIVEAFYYGDKNYNESNATASFRVDKNNVPLSINVTNSNVGGVEQINVTVGNNATGQILLDIGDDHYYANITDGVAQFNITGLNAGEYNVTAIYVENSDYYGNVTNATFVVSKLNTTVRIDVDDITYGEDANITVYVDSGVEGNITIRLDSEVIGTYDIVDGKVNVSVHKPGAGDYTVYAEYNGNYKYNENKTASEGFTVDRATPSITIDSVTVDANTPAVIHVHINPDATGNITICVAGNGMPSYVYEAPIVDGVAEFTLDVLPVNKYNITADFYDDRHGGIDTNYTMHSVWAVYALRVVKVTDYPMSVNATDTIVGENSTITVVVPANATGTVFIDVNGTWVNKRVGEGGITTFNVSKDRTGRYYVIAFLDDNVYAVKSVSCYYYVYPADIPLIIDVAEPVYEGDTAVITVTVPEDIKGPVTIEIDGKSYNNVSFADGNATFEVPNLAPGDKTVVAMYGGDEKYKNNATTAQFTVWGTGNMVLDVENITYGDVETVTVYINTTGSVTLKLNNETYDTRDISGGKVVFPIEGLNAGNYTVEATYIDSLGNITSLKADFTVEKADPIISIEVENIVYGDVEYIVVHVNASGNVTITINGTDINETISLENGHKEIIFRASKWDVPKYEGNASLDVYNLPVGRYNVEATYNGNENYNTATATAEFNVTKADAPIKLDGDTYIKVGDNATIIVTLPENATGNVTVEIDGVKYTSDNITDGVVKFEIPDLAYGNKTVAVTYSGDGNYSSNFTTTKLVVDKYESTVNATIKPEINVGENAEITVEVPKDATGYVIVDINNESYAIKVNNGTGSTTIKGLPSGEYPINVTYLGDEKYFASNNTSSIKVSKVPSTVNVTVENITVGDKAVINISTPEDLCGNVTVSVNGENHTVFVSGGQGTLVLPDLGVGNYTVDVIFDGCKKYEPSNNTATFEVAPIKVTDIKVIDQGNGTITIVAPEIENGNVTVKVGNETYNVTVIDGVATVDLVNNTPGTYNVTVIYGGDDTHASATGNGSATVPKYPSEITADASEITEGEPLVITVEVPEGATGNVTVYIDGKEYPCEVKDGVATVVVDGLTAGNKTYVVEYSGDGNYSANYTIGNVTVKEAKSTPDITVVDQGNGTVVVIVGDNATGNVTVEIDGKNVTAEVKDGVAVVDLGDVAPGTYDIKVNYSGDDTHNPATADGKATVPKHETPISIDVEDSKVGEKSTITVNVPEGATGNITLSIDGKQYTSEIKDGKATFEFDNLTAGNKTIVAEYSGDDSYVGNYTVANVTVSKNKSFVNATIEDINVGENVTITVNVPKDATGQVLIDIDGVGYYANVTDGVGTIQIPRMPDGTYDVSLTYLGDDKYERSSNTSIFKVYKVPSFVIPTAEDITVGDAEVIRLTVPEDATGNVTVIINGTEYSVAVSDGKGIFVVLDLPKGEYVVKVTYNGDNKYLPSSNSTTFVVTKQSTDIEVIDQGNGTVVVVVGDNATGNVTIKVGNDTYTAQVVDGVAVVNLENATPGKHDIEVIYSGDDTHEGETTTATVNIPKYDTPISVEVSDIKVGETAEITVNVPEGATGNIIIEINGKEYSAPISNGKAIFNVPDLAAGNKTVAVKYEGDDNYVFNSTTAQFTVYKNDATANASSVNITVGKDEVITVEVPEDATGRVLVEIDGIGYYGNIVNGKAKIIIPELPSGKYDVNVTYEGDDKYLPCTTYTSFTVEKSSAPTTAIGDVIVVGDDATVVVNVPEDATGTITIIVNGKNYTEEITDGKAVIKIPDLPEGTFDAIVIYSGDKKYEGNTTSAIIVVEGDETPVPDDGKQNGEGIRLSDYPTGNPLWALLLVLLAIGSTKIRRFKK